MSAKSSVKLKGHETLRVVLSLIWNPLGSSLERSYLITASYLNNVVVVTILKTCSLRGLSLL